MRLIIQIVLVLFSYIINSQELIYNSSFELDTLATSNCILNKIGDVEEIVLYWSGGLTSPDIITLSYCDYFDQKPLDGNTCIGFLNWSNRYKFMSSTYDSESITGLLTAPLEPNDKYKFSVNLSWMSKSHGKKLTELLHLKSAIVRSDNLSVCFFRSLHSLNDSLRDCFDLVDNYVTSEWQDVNFEFLPSANHDRIWLGNLNVENTRVSDYPISKEYVVSYVYIDKLELQQVTEELTAIPKKILVQKELKLTEFESGSYELLKSHKYSISQLADSTKTIHILEIIGYADALDNDEPNVVLSSKRAWSVLEFLSKELNLNDTDIGISYKGESEANGKISEDERKVIIKFNEMQLYNP